MNQVELALLALAAVAAVLLWSRIRSVRRRTRKEIPIPVVEGFQVQSPLHPRMLRACVFDLGLPYGPGFRRKEGPALPHGPDCQCRAVPFAVPGTDVFPGSLRKVAGLQCSSAGFPPEACQPLLDTLRRIDAEPLPPSLAGYLALARVDSFASEHRESVRNFLENRHEFLLSLRVASG